MLGWSIAEGEARVERSAYVMPAELLAALPGDQAEMWLTGNEGSPLNDTADPDHPLIVVEVSQRGMDLLGHENFGNAERAEMCEPVPRSTRYSYTGFFDAATRDYLGHTFEALPETAWQSASADFPVPVVERTATPVGTAPIGPETYRTPMPTTTVEQLLSGVETPTPRSEDDSLTLWGAIGGGAKSYVLPASVVTGLSGPLPIALAELRAAVLAPIPGPIRDEPGVIEMLRLPLEVGDEYNYWWHVDKQEDVTVPAGTFRGCFALVEIASAYDTDAHWLCPGVGFVRHELPLCGYSYGGYEVWELADYEIPAITTTGGG